MISKSQGIVMTKFTLFIRSLSARSIVFLAFVSCLAPIAHAEDSNSWVSSGQNIVIEQKPDVFKANWIAPGEELSAQSISRVFYLRKEFQVEDPAAFKRAYVSADSKYKLWVNGVPAARGPQRYNPKHHRYDTVDLSSLVKPGKNTIAAEVIYWGPGGPIFQMSVQPAFLFECGGLQSDDSWKSLVSPGIDTAGMNGFRWGLGYLAGNWLEKVDARLIPVNWNQPEFDDSSWKPAKKLGRAEIWGEGDTRMPWKLLPRDIRPMEERPAQDCEIIQSGLVKDDKDFPPFVYDVEPASEKPSLPVTIPGDGKIHYVVFNAGKLITGYPMLDLEGDEGAVVEIMYTEAPSLNRKKNKRNVFEGDKRVEGYNDVYITRNGRQVYETFLHRTFWYVRVSVKSDKPVTIHGLKYRWTSYNFDERGKFECSDPVLNNIWNVGWYTVRMCAHETYEDCPYYEQLQYVGDTRIQALVTYLASGDPDLPANAIRQMNVSRLPEGLTYSRYPDHVFQVIPGFSLFWVKMVDDYYTHTGDVELLKEVAGGVYSVLRFFESYKTDLGFIAKVPYWNFHDWKFDNGGRPPASEENCTITTMLYKGALDAGVRIFEALGDSHEAARFREKSDAVKNALNQHAWSETEGLYTDGVSIKSLSKHANIYAILFGIADEAKTQRIAKRLFDDPALRSTTFYFAHYLHQVADKLNQPERILNDMNRWISMLDKGTSTWWETPDNTRSDCHAWSATPTYTFMRLILGVRILEPGYKRVQIRPYTSGLELAKGVVPTPHGDIQIDWKQGDKFTLNAVIPEGVQADVVLPNGAAQTIGAGSHTIEG